VRKTNFQTIGIHVLCWALYIAYEATYAQIFPDDMAVSDNFFFFFIINISFFYAHAHFALPIALADKRHVFCKLPVFIILELLAVSLLYILSEILMGHIQFVVEGHTLAEIAGALVFDVAYLEYFIMPVLPYFLYSTGYYFLTKYMREQEAARKAEIKHLDQIIANKELETNLLRIEQDYLRAQINPHLLYNTLSFVNYAARHNPDDAEEAVALLADIMRYALEPSKDSLGLINLGDEINQAANLIALNQLRFSNKLKLSLDVTGRPQTVKTIPLVLLTLVENMFKHGDLYQPATVEVGLHGTTLTIGTENQVSLAGPTGDSTKTGLANIIRRIETVYEGRNRVELGVDGLLYKARIAIDLKENEISAVLEHETSAL